MTRHYLRWILVLCAGIAAASCRLPGAVGCSPETRALAAEDPGGRAALFCRALQGDSDAQFGFAQSLEAAAEDGGEPAVSMKEVAHWYKLAARPTSGSTPVYMAPVGNQKYGWVMNVQTGLASPGDARAQFRLAELYLDGKGVKKNRKKALKWLGRAAAQGYPPAMESLSEMEGGRTAH